MKKKKLIIIVLILLVLNSFVFASTVLAYLASSSQKNNVLYKPVPKVSVVETLSDKKIVAIKNESNFNAYIRVSFVAVYRSTTNSQVIIPAENDVNYELVTGWNSNWTLNGNYYYYNSIVTPGSTTTNILNNVTLKTGKTVPTGYQLEVTVLADSIQSDPITGVTESWGFVP